VINQKQLFDNAECESIIWNSNDTITEWNMWDRKYISNNINFTNETKWIFDKLKFFFETETGLKIVKLKEQIHFHKFVKGDRFEKHNDIKDRRVFGVGVLLNDNFEGGDFKLYDKNEFILNKKIGNTYIFDVNIEHEITKILSGERYSLLWFLHIENIKFNIKELI
jgi:hypothetical protein